MEDQNLLNDLMQVIDATIDKKLNEKLEPIVQSLEELKRGNAEDHLNLELMIVISLERLTLVLIPYIVQ